MDHPFRSAALGGFNKQDVLTFLEEQSKQSAQAQQELQKRLEEAEGQRDTFRKEGEDLRGQLAEAQQELTRLRQEREGLSAQVSKTELELSSSLGRQSGSWRRSARSGTRSRPRWTRPGPMLGPIWS